MKLKNKGLVILLLLSFSVNAQTVKYIDKLGKEISKRKATYKLIIEDIEGDEEHEKITIISASRKRKISEGIFDKGGNHIKDGYFKKFYDKGVIGIEEHYVNNLKEGEAIRYHPNGQIYIRTNFINDHKVGIEKEYDFGGKLVRGSHYDKVKTGQEKLYYKSGAIKEKNIYKEGRLEGKCKTFYESGGLESEKMYMLGKLHGESRNYYKNGSIYSIYNYQNDKRHGEFNEYYKTGELECSGKMSFDVENGEFNSFYKSGRKRRFEYYVFGKANKEQGKCFATNGADTTYFPRIIFPIVNNNKDLADEVIKIVKRNFQYPDYAKAKGVEGLIHVSFVFTKDGKIDDIEIVYPKFYDPSLAAEAMRLVRLIGKENIQHGFFEGKPASIHYTLPVNFKLR